MKQSYSPSLLASIVFPLTLLSYSRWISLSTISLTLSSPLPTFFASISSLLSWLVLEEVPTSESVLFWLEDAIEGAAWVGGAEGKPLSSTPLALAWRFWEISFGKIVEDFAFDFDFFEEVVVVDCSFSLEVLPIGVWALASLSKDADVDAASAEIDFVEVFFFFLLVFFEFDKGSDCDCELEEGLLVLL